MNADGSVVAYHYTHGRNWFGIEESGEIRTTSLYIAPGEKPMAWFTASDSFPTTALPVWRTPAGDEPMTLSDLRRHGGAYRIGVAMDRLEPWKTARVKAGTPQGEADALERLAREKGENPTDWYVSFRPIGRDMWESVEVYFRGVWRSLSFMDGESDR